MEMFYGQITGELVAQEMPARMRTGDVHAAVYDWANKQTYIAHGVTDEDGKFVKQAFEEPFFRFDNQKLWDEAKPDV